MLHYQVSAQGTTYSGYSTGYAPQASFQLNGAFVAAAPVDTTNVSGNGVNLLDIGFLFRNPFGVPQAGSILWASNIGLDDSLITPTRTGAGDLDDATQTYDPQTRTLVTRVDSATAQQITSQFFEITSNAIYADTYRPLQGEIDITFSPDGRSFTGEATLFGVGMIYPGTAAWQATLSGTSTDPQGIALDTNSLGITNSSAPGGNNNSGPLANLPAGTGIAVLDLNTGNTATTAGNTYTGPVAGLQSQIVLLLPDNINMTASIDNVFLHSGSGEDGLTVHGGTNVLDGGTGSNFLVGGSGTDTFFVDDRSAPSDIWSTVNGFHANDAATIWGVTPQDFTLNWVDNQGAAGYTGLTLHAIAAGKATASLTLAGYTSADLSNGRLTVSFGNDPASGSSYMYVHGNS